MSIKEIEAQIHELSRHDLTSVQTTNRMLLLLLQIQLEILKKPSEPIVINNHDGWWL